MEDVVNAIPHTIEAITGIHIKEWVSSQYSGDVHRAKSYGRLNTSKKHGESEKIREFLELTYLREAFTSIREITDKFADGSYFSTHPTVKNFKLTGDMLLNAMPDRGMGDKRCMVDAIGLAVGVAAAMVL